MTEYFQTTFICHSICVRGACSLYHNHTLFNIILSDSIRVVHKNKCTQIPKAFSVMSYKSRFKSMLLASLAHKVNMRMTPLRKSKWVPNASFDGADASSRGIRCHEALGQEVHDCLQTSLAHQSDQVGLT